MEGEEEGEEGRKGERKEYKECLILKDEMCTSLEALSMVSVNIPIKHVKYFRF